MARLEGSRPAVDAYPMGDPTIDGDCIDFTGAVPGTGPNPVDAGPFSVLVLDNLGAPLPTTQVDSWGAHTGLIAGWTLEAKVRGRCPVIQATLVHFSQPALMEAYNADGTLAGTATMSPTQNVAQTLTIQGTSIAFVRIHAPANETLLLRLCCCADLACKADKETKEGKESKDAKELPKELLKERKEFFKEPKELKELPKEQVKEPKEISARSVACHHECRLPPSKIGWHTSSQCSVGLSTSSSRRLGPT